MAIVRKPAAAGGFYPRFKKELLNTIRKSFENHVFGIGHDLEVRTDHIEGERNVIGGICPHAGYIYSGSALSFTIQEIFKEGAPDTVIILGTQHTGYYKIGLMKTGEWETPLGNISVDTDLAESILAETSIIHEDDAAFNGYPHGREHNIEVQIPFIQYGGKKVDKQIQIVPIKLGDTKPDSLEKAGNAIASAIKKSRPKDIVICASSDMTHYQPRNPRNPKSEIKDKQYTRDKAVIKAFEENDWKQTYNKANQTSVCGPQTISTLMIVANKLGYNNPKALKYYTSFEKMGESTPCDYSVGYFAGIISK